MQLLLVSANFFRIWPILFTFKMEAICSSDMSALTRAIRRNFLGDDVVQSHRSWNLTSCTCLPAFRPRFETETLEWKRLTWRDFWIWFIETISFVRKTFIFNWDGGLLGCVCTSKCALASRNNTLSPSSGCIWAGLSWALENGVFWDVMPCCYCKNRHFRGT
jgi:hypothetical protein